MISRRELVQLAAATAACLGANWTRALAQQKLRQADLLRFEPLGNVTIVHVADLHAQLMPVLLREPSSNVGVGASKGQVPHLTGRALLDYYKIEPQTPEAYALCSDDFVALARSYGRVGGLDRIATILNAIRTERAERVLFLDGGDTWQNSYTSLVSKGQDVIDCMALLKPDATTGHWEFTLGEVRLKEIVAALPYPFLAQNVRDTDWEEPVFAPSALYARGGVKIGIIGQALPYTPIANPRWLIPNWSFGIREQDLQKEVEKLRAAGAELIVLLSHNGFDLDRKLATRVHGIDVILTAHTHDCMPKPLQVGKTLLIASGSHGKFVSRLDLDVRDGQVKDYRYKLIPVLADVVSPDPQVAQQIQRTRQPHERMLGEVIGRTETLLYRRGNFDGTFDHVICDALLSERDAELALSPGFRWGTSLLPGQDITREDVYNATAITYPAAYRTAMTGERLKQILEDVADNLFNPDPYYQQGGDMVRLGGLSYTIDVGAGAGQRISDLRLLRTGMPIAAEKEYVVAGWASVNEDSEGPPIWDVVTRYIERKRSIAAPESSHVRVLGA
jgi:S-sulfosulfanyl-L-cysteine sulfohydrolase